MARKLKIYIGWFGINMSAKIFVSKESTKVEVTKKIRGAFLLRMIVSIITSILVLLMSSFWAGKLGYPNKYPHLCSLFGFAGLLIFLNSFTEFYKELFAGLGEFKKLCVITIVEFAGYFLFSVFFLLLFNQIESIAIGYVCSGIFVFLFGVTYLRSIAGTELLPKRGDGCLATMKAIFKYAIPIAIICIGGMVLVEMDTFMLGILSTKSQVANYGIAKNICSKATHINYALTIGSMTSFSMLSVENSLDKKKRFIKVNNLNILIAVGVAIIFFMFGTFAIVMLYGAEYEEAGKLLKYLIPYYIMYSISNFFSVFLDFQGKACFRCICYSGVIILNFCLNYMLIPRLGAVGAAFATGLALLPYTILVIIGTMKIFNGNR